MIRSLPDWQNRMVPITGRYTLVSAGFFGKQWEGRDHSPEWIPHDPSVAPPSPLDIGRSLTRNERSPFLGKSGRASFPISRFCMTKSCCADHRPCSMHAGGLSCSATARLNVMSEQMPKLWANSVVGLARLLWTMAHWFGCAGFAVVDQAVSMPGLRSNSKFVAGLRAAVSAGAE